jgi:UDP-2-acetamido-2-deoxy-ribo-hexuluronate aminotransferase
MAIPLIDLKAQFLDLENDIRARIDKVLAHGHYIMGPEVRELELALEVFTGARHCVTVSSGTEALLISLMALGIGPGDEVITTCFSFAATVEVIALVGATPVYVDIDPLSCNINIQLLEAAITDKTKAIIPVSLYGQVSDMDQINAIAAKYGSIPVIEDAAQSFGATYKGRRSCNLSTVGCTSFFPSKPLGCYGDGGALFTNDDGLAQAAREIRVHGQSRRYVHTRIGVGGRMDTIQCAVVLAKLPYFEGELEKRQQVAEVYLELLSAYEGETEKGGLILPRPQSNESSSAWAQFTIQLAKRDVHSERLNLAGVPTAIHYPIPLNEQLAYRDLSRPAECPEARRVANQVLSLPMGPYLKEDDQCKVVETLVDGL